MVINLNNKNNIEINKFTKIKKNNYSAAKIIKLMDKSFDEQNNIKNVIQDFKK